MFQYEFTARWLCSVKELAGCLFWRVWITLFRSQRKWGPRGYPQVRPQFRSQCCWTPRCVHASPFLPPHSLWALSRCPELFPLSYSVSLLFTLGVAGATKPWTPWKVMSFLLILFEYYYYLMFWMLQPANVGVLSWGRMKISDLWLKQGAYSVLRGRGASTALCCQWEGRVEHSAEVTWTGCINNLEILHIWRPSNFTSRIILWKQSEICNIYEKPCSLKF